MVLSSIASVDRRVFGHWTKDTGREMSLLRESCPQCGRPLINTRFDTTFRLEDATERLCFGIPGGLCEDCHQLYIDPELIDLLDLAAGRCVFAIESDRVLQEEAWSNAG